MHILTLYRLIDRERRLTKESWNGSEQSKLLRNELQPPKMAV